MRINFGLTPMEWRDDYHEWHFWFAWRPVKVDSGDWRWLEKVARIRHVDQEFLRGFYRSYRYQSKNHFSKGFVK